VGGRVDGQEVELAQDLARQRVDLGHALHLVPEQGDPVDRVLVGRVDLEHVAAHPEGAAGELEVVAGVLDVDEVTKHVVEVVEAALLQEDHPLAVLLRAPEAVDRRDARHDYDVAAGEEGARRGVPEAVYVLVDLGVLLDEGVGARDVGLRLVVVVVGDEVLDGVVGEELGELAR
jgi:hypothetical protein